VDYQSHAAALDRNELGALLVAAGLGPPSEHALISLLALNGLRVSEATGADIEHLGLERGYRTLTITRKGGKVVTIPLAPPSGHQKAGSVMRCLFGHGKRSSADTTLPVQPGTIAQLRRSQTASISIRPRPLSSSESACSATGAPGMSSRTSISTRVLSAG
jgi:integrase